MNPAIGTARIIQGDATHLPLEDATVDLVITSPPYFGLRSYQDGGQHYTGQLGDEPTPTEYVNNLITATKEMVRVLKPTGSIWVNLGDKYNSAAGGGGNLLEAGHSAGGSNPQRIRGRAAGGVPAKSLIGIPWRYALRCVDDLGLILRAEIIWSKPNGLPESVTDRVRRSHETWFHFTKQPRYYTAIDHIREEHAPQSLARTGRKYLAGDRFSVGQPNTLNPEQFCNPLGKLPGSVWDIPTQPLTIPDWLGVDHYAAFPIEWPRRIIAGWSPPGICTACGQGRRPVARQVDEQYAAARRGVQRTTDADFQRHVGRSSGATASSISNGVVRPDYRITGYACDCPTPTAPTNPSVILDPFGGTGTTALAAKALGRHGITLDMSADYNRIATWRCSDPGQLASALQVDKPAVQHDGQLDLLDGILG